MQIFQIVGGILLVVILTLNVQVSLIQKDHHGRIVHPHEYMRQQGWNANADADAAAAVDAPVPGLLSRDKHYGQTNIRDDRVDTQKSPRKVLSSDNNKNNNNATTTIQHSSIANSQQQQQQGREPQQYASDVLDLFSRPAPWKTSTVMPKWMKEYFAWHEQQRAAMTPENWNNGTFRYLIVRCVAQDDKCGGTADRLKPLPFYILVAHHLQRILLIWWEKPAPLQEFLVPPPDGGLDWRLPDYMLPSDDNDNSNYEEEGNQYTNTDNISGSSWNNNTTNSTDGDDNISTSSQNYTAILRRRRPDLYGSNAVQAVIGYQEPGKRQQRPKLLEVTRRIQKPESFIVTMRFQTHGHGAYEYNDLRVQYPHVDKKTNQTIIPIHLAKSDDEVEPTYEQVFRDCWYSAFIPVPAIQQRIAEEMTTLGLQRNEFQAIHIRSRYHSKPEGGRLRSLCRNALHCIFQATPQRASETPIYVSADHRSAVWATLVYSRQLALNHVTARDADFLLTLNEQQADEESSTLHMDRGTNHLGRRPKDWTAHQFEAKEFYDTFVDLYILSQAECIAVNVGNYGKWANLLSDKPTCEISHMKLNCQRSAIPKELRDRALSAQE